MNPEKLAKLQAQVRIGGKGTPRRKMKKVQKPAVADDKKLQSQLNRLNAQNIPAIEEVNLFRDDGSVIHVQAPKVQASIACNTFAISGHSQEKDLAELVPGILNQLGPQALSSLQKIAEAYQKSQGGKATDDEVPDLVESFETTAGVEASA